MKIMLALKTFYKFILPFVSHLNTKLSLLGFFPLVVLIIDII